VHQVCQSASKLTASRYFRGHTATATTSRTTTKIANGSGHGIARTSAMAASERHTIVPVFEPRLRRASS
jgi:hypothetical protein